MPPFCPVMDDDGNVVFIAPRDAISPRRRRGAEIAAEEHRAAGLLERIRELDEIKTQFFANVSHELRTPLALVLGPRRAADRRALTRGATARAAQVIARNARMLLKHVNDLLDVAKLEAGKLKIELQDIDLAALVRLVASHFEVLAADRDMSCSRDAANLCCSGGSGEDRARRHEPAVERLQVRARRTATCGVRSAPANE